MQNKKPPMWRSGTRPGAGRVFGGIHVRIKKQHSSQAWRLAAAGVTTGGAAVQTGAGTGEAAAHAAALDRLDWQLARLRRELGTAARWADEGAAIIAELAAMAGAGCG